jgi:endogenous inhibitor of DNA gyrase (YacG/DUF329 family)
MTTTAPRQVACPKCGAKVLWVPESRFRPFCSARCKGLDLGAWASEAYRVAGAAPDDEDESLGSEQAQP